jgi:hypothetical protein
MAVEKEKPEDPSIDECENPEEALAKILEARDSQQS